MPGPVVYCQFKPYMHIQNQGTAWGSSVVPISIFPTILLSVMRKCCAVVVSETHQGNDKTIYNIVSIIL